MDASAISLMRDNGIPIVVFSIRERGDLLRRPERRRRAHRHLPTTAWTTPRGLSKPMADAEKPNLARYRDRMDKAVGALKDEFAGLRTGRASAALLDPIHVDAYGSSMPLNQVGRSACPSRA